MHIYDVICQIHTLCTKISIRSGSETINNTKQIDLVFRWIKVVWGLSYSFNQYKSIHFTHAFVKGNGQGSSTNQSRSQVSAANHLLAIFYFPTHLTGISVFFCLLSLSLAFLILRCNSCTFSWASINVCFALTWSKAYWWSWKILHLLIT